METLAADLEIPNLFTIAADGEITTEQFLQLGYKDLSQRYGITSAGYLKIKS